MTWRHERGIRPLEAASERFAQLQPGVRIEWDARSLSDFEQYPLELLADRYDLIMIDHPHLGAAVRQDLLLPLNDWLPEEFLRDQASHSVGPSYASYTWENRQLALPLDAAAQVSAYRADLLERLSLTVPRTWEEAARLARSLPDGMAIGLPLVPVHAFASFFTLSSQYAKKPFWSDGSPLPPSAGEYALGVLQELAPSLHPLSLHEDPIAMSQRMGATDEIAYIPLIYGYSNYARDGFVPHALRFANIPSDNGAPRGSMIGGVGLAVSARCRHPEIAVRFVRMTADGEFQRTVFVENGGQPGHRSAWLDEEANRRANGFFRETLQTLDEGSVRPRFDGYIQFQEQAGSLIREFIAGNGTDRKALVARLNDMLREAEG
ncbi:carbohydrate ABC transporter substrate-binding protein [Cohnella sp. CBP 2801]|uniref:Carbohydrate ABC transporter substrate-binding protein n=2 Tax=Cohnella zeiphila TaxID=2761120 RepID=A0A7X0SJA7_9BACL|nr:carbohydrate ABC transporter substrate-binding protein [Cohnella zeiphila]